MIGPGMLGGEQQKDEIDVLIIERAEFDGLGEPGEKAHDVGEPRQAAVRNGDAAPDGRGAQALALQQRLENLTRVAAGQLRRLLRELLQRLFFVVRFQSGEDSFARYEITKLHLLSHDTEPRGTFMPQMCRRFGFVPVPYCACSSIGTRQRLRTLRATDQRPRESLSED